MFSPVWQIGLDIQRNSVRAVAIQRYRHKWQLRRWWHYPLNDEVSVDDGQNAEHWIPILQRWRCLLPKRYSLRIALSTSRVMQYKIPIPSQKLDVGAMDWYINAQLATRLSLSGRAITLDYRVLATEPDTFLVTVARKTELDNWMKGLAAANLYPEVVDIAPCVLQRLAQACGVPENCLLVYATDAHVAWISPWEQPLTFGVLPLTEDLFSPAVSAQQHIAASEQAYVALHGQMPTHVRYAAAHVDVVSEEISLLSPFSAVQHLQPPLPVQPSAYALAMGLALRMEDCE